MIEAAFVYYIIFGLAAAAVIGLAALEVRAKHQIMEERAKTALSSA